MNFLVIYWYFIIYRVLWQNRFEILSFLTGEKSVRNEFGQIYIHADSRLDKDDALSQTGQKV